MMLLMIRCASFNPILDPWVYILFRRELIWKVVNVIKCILRIQPQQVTNDPHTKAGMNEENPSCCALCLQCVCEAPSVRPSNYSVSRPSGTFQRSPSYSRRLSESMYGNGTVSSKLIIKPPSPADELVLKAFRKKQTHL